MIEKDHRGNDVNQSKPIKVQLVSRRKDDVQSTQTHYSSESFNSLSSTFNEVDMEQRSDFLNTILMVTHEGIGDETNALSKSLMQAYLRALAEKSPYPKVIIFLNRGVLLSANHSSCLDSLRLMESKGVLILSNCTCLEYHKVMDDLAVGGVTSMYHIVELTKLAKNVITL